MPDHVKLQIKVNLYAENLVSVAHALKCQTAICSLDSSRCDVSRRKYRAFMSLSGLLC